MSQGRAANPDAGAFIASGLSAWMFMLSGMVLLGSAMLIPAGRALREAEHQRDRMVALRDHEQELVERHERYLEALTRGDRDLIVALVERHMNLVPAGRTLLMDRGPEASTPVELFPGLEAGPVAWPDPPPPAASRLSRLVMSDRGRTVVLVFGAVCVLAGLLPPSRGRSVRG